MPGYSPPGFRLTPMDAYASENLVAILATGGRRHQKKPPTFRRLFLSPHSDFSAAFATQLHQLDHQI
ncbi:hypothetical protein Lpp122_2652 [Lacticaseibacillus paracasei subsp. paracasei Lpp122]|uniref:Uncharacterized protein n=1 Tax=Lacticaseibacillus paracasei subsp. paracasei Lpp122 TaxID=1256218 RepID=A0A8E0I2X6_LACPA|nr:hypothetical protein Lpp122_2652 [Lacticaseibacillus paracasei subsp. paracasei Lpp122]